MSRIYFVVVCDLFDVYEVSTECLATFSRLLNGDHLLIFTAYFEAYWPCKCFISWASVDS